MNQEANASTPTNQKKDASTPTNHEGAVFSHLV